MEPPTMRSENWGYVRVFAVVWLVLFGLVWVDLLFRQDVVLAEKVHRLLITAPLLFIQPFVCAAVPVIVPRLWFWPWNRR